MSSKTTTELRAERNQVLNSALALLKPHFSIAQIVCCVDEDVGSEDAPHYSTYDYRRGFGDHNARIGLCRKQVIRADAEMFAGLIGNVLRESKSKERRAV